MVVILGFSISSIQTAAIILFLLYLDFGTESNNSIIILDLLNIVIPIDLLHSFLIPLQVNIFIFIEIGT